jgi:hypothetical protein
VEAATHPTLCDQCLGQLLLGLPQGTVLQLSGYSLRSYCCDYCGHRADLAFVRVGPPAQLTLTADSTAGEGALKL